MILVTTVRPCIVLLALISRQALDLISLLGLGAKLIFSDLAKTNLLVRHIHKSKGNDHGDREMAPTNWRFSGGQ